MRLAIQPDHACRSHEDSPLLRSALIGLALVPIAFAASAQEWKPEPASRELVVTAHSLHLPIQEDAPLRRLRLVIGDRTVREFDIKLAEGRPDYWVQSDLRPFRGQRVRIEVSPPGGLKGLDQIRLADQVPGGEEVYREKHRPQFHFTARRGWLNDPNGLLWHDGEYHLFFQHNPYGWDWGNMHWGHAVSRDLVHWTEAEIALGPRRYGDWSFSGSGVVDRQNTSGFGTDQAPPLVVAFTSTGRGECIASSNDRGRTWTEYEGNPVIRHQGRDPRLLWYEPTRRWIMAVYDESEGRQGIAFHSSPDLKSWSYESRIDGFFECPDLFELPVKGEPGKSRWVLSAADGEYRLGQFDGHRFTPESGKHRLWYGDFYAAQTFSDPPDGRRIQIGWGRGITFPGMPFNQQMTIPCELTLRPTPEEVRMFAQPIAELSSLRSQSHTWRDLVLKPGEDPLADLSGDLLEVQAEAEVGTTSRIVLTVHGLPIIYDAGCHTLSCGDDSAPLGPVDGLIRLHVLIDSGSVEVFGNDGQVAISHGVIPPEDQRGLALSTTGAGTRILRLQVDELTSAWLPTNQPAEEDGAEPRND